MGCKETYALIECIEKEKSDEVRARLTCKIQAVDYDSLDRVGKALAHTPRHQANVLKYAKMNQGLVESLRLPGETDEQLRYRIFGRFMPEIHRMFKDIREDGL